MRKLAELYIKVSIIVRKGVSGLQKGFFWAQFRSSISELVEARAPPIQMHLSEKPKTFCCHFIAFLECTLNFEHFEKKNMSLIA